MADYVVSANYLWDKVSKLTSFTPNMQMCNLISCSPIPFLALCHTGQFFPRTTLNSKQQR